MKNVFRVSVVMLYAFPAFCQITAESNEVVSTLSKRIAEDEAFFKHVDRNGDGNIDRKEGYDCCQDQIPSFPMPPVTHKAFIVQSRAKFYKLDTNRDGLLTVKEMMAHDPKESHKEYLAGQEETFDALDYNQNGKIDKNENFAPFFMPATKAEFMSKAQLYWTSRDTNCDGFLDSGEKQAPATQQTPYCH